MRASVKALATEERADFLQLLRQLTPEQWDTPSLCAGWSVRDVALHVVSYEVTTAFGGRIALADCMIHQQDIRRALKLPRNIPDERLRIVLDFALIAPPLPAKTNRRGLRLTATDLDWSVGAGPEVIGPGEALLMAAAGRADALDDLTGPGVTTLRQRVLP